MAVQSPGLGVLTGEPGVGKTSVLRALTYALNPDCYQVIYLSETDLGRLDLYKSLALAHGITPPHRRAQLWRELKARILDLTDTQQIHLGRGAQPAARVLPPPSGTAARPVHRSGSTLDTTVRRIKRGFLPR